MATVKGDVHDIGKNIVGVVLGCNGYEIHDLGVMVPAEQIVAKARELQVDVIGLSGLITPSLDEMVHVARELEREGFGLPLLIGGATTSRMHTAVKIEPEYSGPISYVVDASRAVGVVGALLDPARVEDFMEESQTESARLRERFEGRNAGDDLLSLRAARENRFESDWPRVPLEKPSFTGVRVIRDHDLADLAEIIDWTPFFSAWELRGAYPRILDDPRVGAKARELWDDARRLLDRIVLGKELQAHGVYGLWPAGQVDHDDIALFADGGRTQEVVRLHTLREQRRKRDGLPNLALADFVAPADGEHVDHVGLFAVTTGHGLDAIVKAFEADHDDYNAILAQSLADRLAEAFAERMHAMVRSQWGYDTEESLSVEDLIKERYRGIRPAPGYPAQPDHTEKRTLWELLDPEAAAQMRLTESYAMWPAGCGFGAVSGPSRGPVLLGWTVGPRSSDGLCAAERDDLGGGGAVVGSESRVCSRAID